MLYLIIKMTIMSIILIFLVSHLLNFFKDSLTSPKIKDLVNIPSEKYDKIFKVISLDRNNNNTTTSISSIKSQVTEDNLIPKIEVGNTSMKDELKMFIKKQLNSPDEIQPYK